MICPPPSSTPPRPGRAAGPAARSWPGRASPWSSRSPRPGRGTRPRWRRYPRRPRCLHPRARGGHRHPRAGGGRCPDAGLLSPDRLPPGDRPPDARAHGRGSRCGRRRRPGGQPAVGRRPSLSGRGRPAHVAPGVRINRPLRPVDRLRRGRQQRLSVLGEGRRDGRHGRARGRPQGLLADDASSWSSGAGRRGRPWRHRRYDGRADRRGRRRRCAVHRRVDLDGPRVRGAARRRAFAGSPSTTPDGPGRAEAVVMHCLPAHRG